MPWIDKSLRTAAFVLLSTLVSTAQQPVAPPSSQAAPAIPGPQSRPAEPAFTVVLDAAHGGRDGGAKLSPSEDEKTVTLDLAEHLHAMLSARGISNIMTRSGDVDVPATVRAGVANHAQAAACLILHATASGTGVHLFTSSLNPAPRTPMPAWTSAQAGYVEESLKLSSDIDSALAHASIPVIIGRTYLAPLDNLTCPAVAIEVAPIRPGSISKGQAVDDPSYQAAVLNAVAAALLQWREDWKQQP
jgi:N-acetylmuramoyl-L-alanine amidase